MAALNGRSGSLRIETFAFRNAVPKPAGRLNASLAAIRGTLAPICSRGVMPTAASITGKLVSLTPRFCHRTVESPIQTAPGATRLALSIQANGVEVEIAPEMLVGAANATSLGGVAEDPLPPPFPPRFEPPGFS